ncbi:MAG TPA: OmpA family protein [Alphaproteobacteria bacterium]|nr:OmpA family protein [Alphaproteobacteria bacterium]
MMNSNDWSRAAVAAAAFLCAAAPPALAQYNTSRDASQETSWFDGGSWYVSGSGGWNWQQHPRLLVPGTGPNAVAQPFIRGSVPAKPDYDSSYVGLLSFGRSFGSTFGDWMNGFRVELEAGYRDGKIHAIDSLGNAVGHSQVWSGMVNGLYDLNLGPYINGIGLKPYIGIGIGAADDQNRNIHLSYSPGPVSSASRTAFAYQGIAGVGYAVTPNLTLGVEYRYFGLADHPTGMSNNYKSQAALVNVRWAFGGPEQQETRAQSATYVPPPPPPPAPTVRNYLVFFDFDKSDLTPEARRIVDQAASNSKTANVTQINVTGYTDTVGSEAYNMRLSRRRAEAVAAELEANGIQRSEMEIVGKGKHDLLVPTADGVREPQNRRVQIILGGSNGSTS